MSSFYLLSLFLSVEFYFAALYMIFFLITLSFSSPHGICFFIFLISNFHLIFSSIICLPFVLSVKTLSKHNKVILIVIMIGEATQRDVVQHLNLCSWSVHSPHWPTAGSCPVARCWQSSPPSPCSGPPHANPGQRETGRFHREGSLQGVSRWRSVRQGD